MYMAGKLALDKIFYACKGAGKAMVPYATLLFSEIYFQIINISEKNFISKIWLFEIPAVENRFPSSKSTRTDNPW